MKLLPAQQLPGQLLPLPTEPAEMAQLAYWCWTHLGCSELLGQIFLPVQSQRLTEHACARLTLM